MRALAVLLSLLPASLALAQGPPGAGADAVETPPEEQVPEPVPDEYTDDFPEEEDIPVEATEPEPDIDELDEAGAVCVASPCPLPSNRVWGPTDLAEPTPRSLVEHWETAEPRTFLSASIDLGFLYLRPRFGLGYGLPHASWIGIEANPIVSGVGAGGYMGLRATLPEIGLRVGGRYFYSWYRSLLVPDNTYDRQKIELRTDASQYLSLEAELSTSNRVGPGVVSTELAVTYVTGLPDDRYVFEETIRVIVAPPWVFRGRIAYGFETGPDNVLRIGPAFDVLYVPERKAWTFRAGLIARLRLFDDLEIRATYVPVFISPDNLGTAGGDFGLIGVRYNWATR